MAPVGLQGVLIINALVRGVIAAFNFAGVILNPSCSVVGTTTGVPSARSTMSVYETQ